MVAVSTRGPTGASPPPLSSQNMQSHEKSFTSPWARGAAPTMRFVLGTNSEGKDRFKGNASRIQISRIGSGLRCVRRNAQHLKLTKTSRIHVICAQHCSNVCCIHLLWAQWLPSKSSSPISSQNMQSHEKSPTSRSAQGETQTISLAQDATPGGRERVNVKAGRIQCVCVCVCVFIKLHITAQSGPFIRAIWPCHPRHSMSLALILPRGDQ